jgi:hypothetical protein
MRILVALLSLGVVLGGCGLGLPSQPLGGAWPPPVFGGSKWPASGAPKAEEATCPERLTEAACTQATQCRWVGEHRRTDGTLASPHCARA